MIEERILKSPVKWLSIFLFAFLFFSFPFHPSPQVLRAVIASFALPLASRNPHLHLRPFSSSSFSIHTGIFILFAQTFTYFSFFFTSLLFSPSLPVTLTHDDSSLVQVTTSYTHSLSSPLLSSPLLLLSLSQLNSPLSLLDSSTLDLTTSFTCMYL